jgi:DNA-binding transcriptional LysR family regulator
MTDLNELQFFVEVAKRHSFTLAAKRLGVPKSSVSRSIFRLETRLGVRLVARTTRSVALTEAGEVYLDRCQRVLEEAEQAEIEIGALEAKPRGKLRVGAPAIFARAILGPTLGEFLALYPDVRLHLETLGDAPQNEKNLDLVIRPGPLEDSRLLVKPLFKIRRGAYGSPAYLSGRHLPDSPAALRDYSCITTSCGTFGEPAESAIWRLRRNSELREIRVEARASVPDPTICQQLAVSGVGVALLSQSAVRRDVERGRLVRLLPDWEPEPIELYALYSSRLSASPKVRVFLQFLRERFGAEHSLNGANTKLRTAHSQGRTEPRGAPGLLDGAGNANPEPLHMRLKRRPLHSQ